MSFFKPSLSLWIALCIPLGSLLPGLFQLLALLEYGSVDFVVAILIWFPVSPIMLPPAAFAGRTRPFWHGGELRAEEGIEKHDGAI